MKNNKNLLLSIAAALGFIVLILDVKTSIAAARDGVQLCLYSVVPTLLPFCVLSKLLNAYFLGINSPILRPIGRICGIPKGAESILLSGFLGGYPVGAQGINDACKSGAIQLVDAQRSLAFCSNAGPAFIFGMIGYHFTNKKAVWLLLGIHILSALAVGIILPNKSHSTCRLAQNSPPKLTKLIEESVKSMALVSTWIILFRIILHFCQRWFFWQFSSSVQAALSGALELANGCVSLSTIESEGLRFILAAGFIGFGGICVAMQTISVTKDVSSSLYFPGKILQTCFSILMAGATQYLVFPTDACCRIPLYIPIIFCGIIAGILTFTYSKKKVVAFA